MNENEWQFLKRFSADPPSRLVTQADTAPPASWPRLTSGRFWSFLHLPPSFGRGTWAEART